MLIVLASMIGAATTYTPLTRALADTLYCKITDGCSSTSNDFEIYFNHSIYHNIEFNLTESDSNDIDLYVVPGEKFVFGGTFT